MASTSRATSVGSLAVVLAITTPSGAEDPDQHEQRMGGIQQIAVSAGGMDYTENNVVVFDYGGGYRKSDPFRTRGGWAELDGQYEMFRWFALAMRARVGSLERGPATAAPSNETVTGGDFATLDPKLGDDRVGGSVAPMVRFLPGHTALDLGVTLR
jgi:hypothetical protein